MGQVIILVIISIVAIVAILVKTVIQKTLEIAQGMNAKSIAGEVRAMNDLLTRASQGAIQGTKAVGKGFRTVFDELGNA